MKARFINPYTDFGFKKLFGEEANKMQEIMNEKAKLVNSSQQQMQAYEDSLKTYRDLKGVIDTSHDEGYDEGHENGIKEGVEIGLKEGVDIGLKEGEERGLKKGLKEGEKNKTLDMAWLMKQKGYPVKEIAELTGLTPADIEKL